MKFSMLGACLLFGALLLSAPANAAQDERPAPSLLSAYFGLDNALPLGAVGLCRGANGRDGMPVITSRVIDPETLDADDFQVITESGAVSMPLCATLRPAIDEGELRTVLLIGEFGDDGGDPPARVEIVGDLLASDETHSSFQGASVAVTPLSAGPSIIAAETVPLVQWQLDRQSGRQQGTGCPSDGTVQVVRVTWAGGVSNAEGNEAGELERSLYRVTLRAADGTESVVTPFALADLGDGDNNHLLCLEVRGEPLSVAFPAGYLYDPNEDTLNPESQAAIRIDPASIVNGFRNVRYCEIIPTFRRGLSLESVVWNTLGLNDCPQAAWDELDAQTIQDELGAVNVNMNGPRYWVLDEIGALGGVTAAGNRMMFGSIEFEERAVLSMPLSTRAVEPYQAVTVDRNTRYVYYAGELIYTLVSPNGETYVMQSYAQIVDPELTIEDLATLGDRLSLPEGWSFVARAPEADVILLARGEATVVQDNLQNTYQLMN